MSKLPEEYIKHILLEIEYLLGEMKILSFERFLDDPTHQRAFARSLGIIGEATKKIPVSYRQKYPDIDWKAIAGIRDRLIHDYLGVDYEIVWDVVVNEIPKLKDQLEKILHSPNT